MIKHLLLAFAYLFTSSFVFAEGEKTLIIQPAQKWDYQKVVIDDPFNGRKIPLEYDLGGAKCPFTQEQPEDYNSFLKNARGVLSSFEDRISECQLPSADFNVLDNAILAYGEEKSVSESAYGSATGNELTCYNYQMIYEQDHYRFQRAIDSGSTYSGYLLSSCVGEVDPNTCASIEMAQNIEDMHVKCENSLKNIEYENKVRLKMNSAKAVNSLLESAFERLQSPKCKGQYPDNMYKSLVQTTVGAVGAYASIGAATSGASYLLAQGSSLINKMIDLFSKDKSYVEELQKESEFNDLACFYLEVKRRAFGCEKFDLAQKIEKNKSQYEEAVRCSRKLETVYDYSLPSDINSVASTLQDYYSKEDERLNQKVLKRAKLLKTSPEKIDPLVVLGEEGRKKKIDNTKLYIDQLMEHFDAEFDYNDNGESFGSFIKKGTTPLLKLNENDSYIREVFNLDAPERIAKKKNIRAFRLLKKKVKSFTSLYGLLERYAESIDENDKLVEQIQTEFYQFNKEFPGGLKYHMKHFLKMTSRLTNNPSDVLSLMEGHKYTISKFKNKQKKINQGIGRESLIVMNGMMSHMPVLFSNRLLELGKAMAENIHDSKGSEFAERNHQFESYVRPLLKTCHSLASVGVINKPDDYLNAASEVRGMIHSKYAEYCAPFFCESGDGLKAFARPGAKTKKSNIPKASLIIPKCDKDAEQCIIQHYKKMSCNEDNLSNSLINSFEKAYEDFGTICGKPIKKT